jgi:serine/threonine protein kinase
MFQILCFTFYDVWLQEYLHFYCDPPLYHGDVKPSNVFLDKNYLAKVIHTEVFHNLQSYYAHPNRLHCNSLLVAVLHTTLVVAIQLPVAHQ